MGLNEDILIGASCGDYVHGGGRCCDDNDCNGNGICIQGQCMCKSGYVCDHCSALALDIVNGSKKKKIVNEKIETSCPCDNINCGKHGMCEGGKCICDPGYKGQYCTINVMKLLFI